MSARRASAALGLSIAATAAAAAQQDPRIGYVYPAGAQRGTERIVTVGGQRLAGASWARVSGAGVRAEVLKHRGPIQGRKLQRLRDGLQELRKAGRIRPGRRLEQQPELEALLAELGLDRVDLERWWAEQRRRGDPLAQVNADLAETLTLRIVVAPDAAPGQRELRLRGERGLSNPLPFVVSQLLEVEEAPRAAQGAPPQGAAQVAQVVTQGLPLVLNGQVLPGEVDRYRFRARAGTQLVAAVAARSLVPYLADAVPGWFQATLTLKDGAGKELAYVDDFRFSPDPILSLKVPADGEYLLEIKDALFRGREDFVYRISLGDLPCVTGVFPLGGPVGRATQVQAQGWNLPPGRLGIRPERPGVDPAALVFRRGDLLASPFPFAAGDLPEVVEQEPGAALRRVRLPLVVNGRIGRPGEWDVFYFPGRAGQRVVAEVQARRLLSPLDSVLQLVDASGKLVAANDDHEDRGGGLETHQSDSRLEATLPADGEYRLRLGDAQGQGGPAHAYRLRIGPPQPDFELRVVPASLNGRAGETLPIKVYALRRDGYQGEIALELEGAPPGFALGGARIPAGQDEVLATLTTPRAPLKEPLELRLEGVARAGEATLRRRAVPAEDAMQAFLYRHLVPAEAWLFATRGAGVAPPPPRLLGDLPVALHPGQVCELRYARPRGRLRRPGPELALELLSAVPGVRVEEVRDDAEAGATVVRLSVAADARVGLEGNLVLAVHLGKGRGKGQGRVQAGPRLGVLPAVPFRIEASAPTRASRRAGERRVGEQGASER